MAIAPVLSAYDRSPIGRKTEIIFKIIIKFGGVAEWTNALVLKTSRPEMVSGVRILPPPFKF